MKQSVKTLDLYADELAQEIVNSKNYHPHREEGYGITRDELQAKLGLSQTSARRLLSDKLKAGWKKELMIDKGHLVAVYHK